MNYEVCPVVVAAFCDADQYTLKWSEKNQENLYFSFSFVFFSVSMQLREFVLSRRSPARFCGATSGQPG